MTRPSHSTPRRLLGEVLLGWKSITPEQLDAALREQAAATGRQRLGRILLLAGHIDELTLAAALAEVHQVPFANLDEVKVDPAVARTLPAAVAERHNMLPLFRKGDTVTVAASDPVDVIAQDELRARLHGDRIDIVIAPESQIHARVAYVWGDQLQRKAVTQLVQELRVQSNLEQSQIQADGAVAVVDELMTAAARHRASDIHVEPTPSGLRVRMRIDGVLREVLSLPKTALGPLTSRIKIISGLSVTERRVPQDGRTTLDIGGHRRDVRVSTLPSIHGEKVVLRMLPVQEALPKLSEIGLTPAQEAELREAMSQPQGFVLVTGPTGAGKSSTLYVAISETIQGNRSVVTLEDPVEMELSGITQVQINEKAGLTFRDGLRSILRQDPDVVMVGEIRDRETGQMAVRAALTGHLVISTLHTIDAPSAVVRLIEMGIPTYLAVRALRLVVAQRLVRRPCPQCVRPWSPDPDTVNRLRLTPEQARTMVTGAGCSHCDGTGYYGRTGVFEVLPITDSLRQLLLGREPNEDDIRREALRGMWRPVLERAIEAAVQGLTTPDEVLRALALSPESADDEESDPRLQAARSQEGATIRRLRP